MENDKEEVSKSLSYLLKSQLVSMIRDLNACLDIRFRDLKEKNDLIRNLKSTTVDGLRRSLVF